jgi:hypothetical protein
LDKSLTYRNGERGPFLLFKLLKHKVKAGYQINQRVQQFVTLSDVIPDIAQKYLHLSELLTPAAVSKYMV